MKLFPAKKGEEEGNAVLAMAIKIALIVLLGFILLFFIFRLKNIFVPQ